MNHSELIIPNQHVALIHAPIVLLMLGLLVEVACAVAARQSSARIAGRWMILFGAALGWPSVFSGLFALRDVAAVGNPDLLYAPWHQKLAESPMLTKPALWETLRAHLLVAAGAIALANVVVIGWLMAGERVRRALYVPSLLLLALSCAAIGFAAWNGGELVYWNDATGIADSPGIAGTVDEAGEGTRPVERSITAIVPPLQTHVTLAGLATGLILLTWAVASRTRTAPPAVTQAAAALPSDPFFAAFQTGPVQPVRDAPGTALGWLTVLAIAATGVFGWWTLAIEYESWSPRTLLAAVLDVDNKAGPVSRRAAHAIGAGALVFLTLLVAYAGRWSRRSRVVPLLVGFLLLAAVLAQTWLGLLLLLDTNSGPLVMPNAAESVEDGPVEV